MIASVIVVCLLQTGECQLIANGLTRTEEECHVISEIAITWNMQRAEEGTFPPHIATHQCVDFGLPT
jgi:hypothetical protein